MLKTFIRKIEKKDLNKKSNQTQEIVTKVAEEKKKEDK